MLCRILTELKLLETPVGLIVLAAGVTNDVIGMCTSKKQRTRYGTTTCS